MNKTSWGPLLKYILKPSKDKDYSFTKILQPTQIVLPILYISRRSVEIFKGETEKCDEEKKYKIEVLSFMVEINQNFEAVGVPI